MVNRIPPGVRTEILRQGGDPGPNHPYVPIKTAKNLKRKLLGLCGKRAEKTRSEIYFALKDVGLAPTELGAFKFVDSLVLSDEGLIYGSTPRGRDRILHFSKGKTEKGRIRYFVNAFVDDEESGID